MTQTPAQLRAAVNYRARQSEKVARMKAALEFYADPKNWFSPNREGPGRHQMGAGSMERMIGRPGTVSGLNFIPDAGDIARQALAPTDGRGEG